MEAVVHYDKNSDHFEYAKKHPNKNKIKGLDEVKHISLVIADAWHPPIGAKTSEKLVDPGREVDEDKEVEAIEGDGDQPSFPHSFHLLLLINESAPQQADSSLDTVPREGPQHDGIEREDGLANKEKGDDNEPEELAKETKIGLALAHQTPVCVEDDKGAKDEGEDQADDVDLRHKIPRQDEGRAREVPGFRVLLVENQ